MELTGIRAQLETYGWIAAIPFGTADRATETCCPSSSTAADCEAGITLDKQNPCSFNAGGCCGVAPSRGIDDVGFAREVLRYLQKNMCGSVSTSASSTPSIFIVIVPQIASVSDCSSTLARTRRS